MSTNKIDLVRAEIKRRIVFQKECIKNSYRLTGKPEEEIILEYKQLLSFIDSLPEEPASIDFEQELYKAFGQVKDFTLGMRIAKWFYDMGKNSQEPVNEKLEEAASIYQTFHRFSTPYKIFIEGAQWQKQQDQSTIELAEDHAMLAGMEKMKEEMIAKAIDGQLENGEDYLRIKCLSTGCQPQDDGKLVKLIIIKED